MIITRKRTRRFKIKMRLLEMPSHELNTLQLGSSLWILDRLNLPMGCSFENGIPSFSGLCCKWFVGRGVKTCNEFLWRKLISSQLHILWPNIHYKAGCSIRRSSCQYVYSSKIQETRYDNTINYIKLALYGTVSGSRCSRLDS